MDPSAILIEKFISIGSAGRMPRCFHLELCILYYNPHVYTLFFLFFVHFFSIFLGQLGPTQSAEIKMLQKCSNKRAYCCHCCRPPAIMALADSCFIFICLTNFCWQRLDKTTNNSLEFACEMQSSQKQQQQKMEQNSGPEHFAALASGKSVEMDGNWVFPVPQK